MDLNQFTPALLIHLKRRPRQVTIITLIECSNGQRLSNIHKYELDGPRREVLPFLHGELPPFRLLHQRPLQASIEVLCSTSPLLSSGDSDQPQLR